MKKIKKFFIFIFIILIILFLFSKFIGIKGLFINEYKLKTNLNSNYDGLKIVHISDIHYNHSVKKNELKNIVKKVNEINPDIVVITGDIFSDIKEDKYLIKYLSNIKSTIGTFIIKGESDLDSNWDNFIKETEFIDINNTSQLIFYKGNIPIIISGISTVSDNINLSDKINNLTVNNEYYSILLVHEPDIIKNIDLNNYDLILAGHSHGGQIRLPYITFKGDNSSIYYEKYYSLDNSKLFISYGLGTKDYDLRLFNHPSINFYRLFTK